MKYRGKHNSNSNNDDSRYNKCNKNSKTTRITIVTTTLIVPSPAQWVGFFPLITSRASASASLDKMEKTQCRRWIQTCNSDFPFEDTFGYLVFKTHSVKGQHKDMPWYTLLVICYSFLLRITIFHRSIIYLYLNWPSPTQYLKLAESI